MILVIIVRVYMTSEDSVVEYHKLFQTLIRSQIGGENSSLSKIAQKECMEVRKHEFFFHCFANDVLNEFFYPGYIF